MKKTEIQLDKECKEIDKFLNRPRKTAWRLDLNNPVVIETTPEAISKYLRKNEDIKTARRCLNFKLIKCNNKNCLNKFCPLQKSWD